MYRDAETFPAERRASRHFISIRHTQHQQQQQEQKQKQNKKQKTKRSRYLLTSRTPQESYGCKEGGPELCSRRREEAAKVRRGEERRGVGVAPSSVASVASGLSRRLVVVYTLGILLLRIGYPLFLYTRWYSTTTTLLFIWRRRSEGGEGAAAPHRDPCCLSFGHRPYEFFVLPALTPLVRRWIRGWWGKRSGFSGWFLFDKIYIHI